MNQKKRRMYGAMGLVGVASMVLAGCGATSKGATASIKNITIAAQDYSEAVIDDYLIANMIEAKTPIKVTVKSTSGASYLMHSMLMKGDIQMYTGYDGTEFQEMLKQSYVGKFAGHPDRVTQYVKQQEMKQYGVWMSPSLGYQDTYALAVNQSTATKDHLKTDSDAAKYASSWHLGTDTTFPNMANTGLTDFEKAYGLHFAKVTPMSYDLLYEALAKNSVQAIIAYSTDGRLRKLHEIPLTDDKSFFPPYHAVVLMKASVRKEAHLDQVLAPLWGAVTTADQIEMNYDVDVLKKDPNQVAHDFLVKKGLISS